MVDLRSDTVTRPSEAMREVMRDAVVGDDVLGDDETVIRLQEMGASMLGKEAALFVPSGTMSNAVAIKTHTRPGDEMVVEHGSHIYQYEGGGYAALAGCSVALVHGSKGMMTTEQVSSSIRKSAGSMSHYPDGSLVCIENTTNRGGGMCWQQENLDGVSEVAHEADCRVHVDGARLFNAVVHTGVSADRMVRNCDSVSICLSKGLGAPVGSLLIGDEEFISDAHRWRKMFGGGMRQAGIIAAAGIHALENNINRLGLDHERISTLAAAIEGMERFSIGDFETNILQIEVDEQIGTASQVVTELAKQGVQIFDISPTKLRAVSHLDIDDAGIQQAIAAFGSLDA